MPPDFTVVVTSHLWRQALFRSFWMAGAGRGKVWHRFTFKKISDWKT